MNFFEYFKALGFPYIRKPNGVNEGIVRAAAALMDASKEDMRWLRRQFLPQLCDDDRLNVHAAARGIERFKNESDTHFRNRVASAFMFHATGGTRSGVDAFLRAIGLDAHIVEPGEYDGLEWAEFALRINTATLDQTVNNRAYLATLVNELKPARSLLKLIIFETDLAISSSSSVGLSTADEVYLPLVAASSVGLRTNDTVHLAIAAESEVSLSSIDAVHLSLDSQSSVGLGMTDRPVIDFIPGGFNILAGAFTLDGSRALDGGWGSMTITDS